MRTIKDLQQEILPMISFRMSNADCFTAARLASKVKVSRVRTSPCRRLISPMPLHVEQMGEQSFASWPRASLPFCCAQIVHNTGHSLDQCPLFLQCPHMLFMGSAGSGSGERWKAVEKLRRRVLKVFDVRLDDLGGTWGGGGVRGGVCAINPSIARNKAS